MASSWIFVGIAVVAAIGALAGVLRASYVYHRQLDPNPVSGQAGAGSTQREALEAFSRPLPKNVRQASDRTNKEKDGGVVRVLVVDDEDGAVKYITEILERSKEIEVVGVARNSVDAFRMTMDLLPDVITMDIRMPGLNGIEATRVLKLKYPAIKIVMLTAHGEVDFLYESLSAGASGFIVKLSSDSDIIRSILGAAEGRYPVDAMLASSLLAEFSTDTRWPDSLLPPTLTENESATLTLLAQNLSYKQIADQLDLPRSVVDKHITNIVLKLQLHRQVEEQIKKSSVVFVDILTD